MPAAQLPPLYLRKSPFLSPGAWEENRLTVTQFERYILCPYRFFLEQILKVEDLNTKRFEQEDERSVGSLVHATLEQFSTRLVIAWGNEGYVKQAPLIFSQMVDLLKHENILLNPCWETWKKAPCSTGLGDKDFHIAWEEAIANLQGFEDAKGIYSAQRGQELAKRALLQFLLSEKAYLEKNSIVKACVAREYRLEFPMGPFHLIGKVDRIDLTEQGALLVDYKVSRLPQEKAALLLFPQEFPQKKKVKEGTKFSAQGALYARGYLHQNHEEEMWDRVAGFALFCLKGVDVQKDNVLTYDFSPPLTRQSLAIYDSYEEKAYKLKEGDFSPQPLGGEFTCQYCPHTSRCPRGISEV